MSDILGTIEDGVKGPSEFLTLARKIHFLSDLLVNFGKSTFGEVALNEAWHEFSSWTEERYPFGSPEKKIFLPWFVYNWKPYKEFIKIKRVALPERTVAECYLIKNKGRLPIRDLEIISMTGLQRPSFYQVKECLPGTGMKLLDLFTSQECSVFDMWKSQSVVPGDIFLALLCPLPDIQTFIIGSGPALPRRFKEKIARLSTAYNIDKKVRCSQDLDEYRAEIFEIYDEILRELRIRPEPTRKFLL